MALNLTGFLGGLGEGYGAYAKDKAIKEREALAERKLDQADARMTYDRMTQILKDDAADELNTLTRLRNPGIDQITKQAEMDARRNRYESNRSVISQLAAQPGMTKTFGNLTGLLKPSSIAGPGFKAPAAEIDPYKAFDIAQKERARIEQMPGDASVKAAGVAQARQFLVDMVPQAMLDRILPEFGKSLGYGPATQAARPLEKPEDFFAQNQGFVPGQGGERILPTGAKQVVKYRDGVPYVEYQPELKATYESPESKTINNQLKFEQVRKLQGLYDSTVREAESKADIAEWNAKLKGKQYDWFDKIQTADINKKNFAAQAAGASNALRRLGIMLAHQDRVAGMDQRDAQFGQMMGFRGQQLSLQSATLQQRAKEDFLRNYDSLNKQFLAARTAAGKSQSLGMGPAKDAAIKNMNDLAAQIKGMKSQFDALNAGNMDVANQIAGVQPIPQGFTPQMMAASGMGGMAGGGMAGGYGAGAMGGGGGGGSQVDMGMIAAMLAQGMGQGQPAAQQPININIPAGFGMPGGMGMPAQQPGINQNDLMAAITRMLTARGVIPQGTDETGAFIPAGKPGSVFPKISDEQTRISKIRSSLNLLHIGDDQVRDLAYKYPTGFPPGSLGQAIKQTLKESDAKAARAAPGVLRRNTLTENERKRQEKAREEAALVTGIPGGGPFIKNPYARK